MFTLYPHSIPRCQHIKVNGTQCGSPALRRNRLCYFHKTWQGARIALGANRARRAAPSSISPCSKTPTPSNSL